MTDKGMPEKIWASEVKTGYGEWQDAQDGLPMPLPYIRKDLADELARAMEYEREKGRLSVSSATILARYHAATEGK